MDTAEKEMADLAEASGSRLSNINRISLQQSA